jgi:hypothetical protein
VVDLVVLNTVLVVYTVVVLLPSVVFRLVENVVVYTVVVDLLVLNVVNVDLVVANVVVVLLDVLNVVV